MGFFGWIGSKIKSGCEKVKNGLKKAKDWMKEKATNAWNKFTGKDKFEEAEQLYDKICDRYNSRRKQFEADVETYSNNIENHIDSINNYKAKIKNELFPQMAEKLNKIWDVNVSKEFNFEEFEIKDYSIEELRSKEQLYKIDFSKHPIKSNALAVLTLGFYTRKKAKETLSAVQEEGKKIDYEISKMNSETARLKAIDASLANIDFYFEELINIYENMLVRLDSSVNFLFVRCMTFAHRIIKQEMSIRHLSKTQIKEIQALTTASIILKKMTAKSLVSLEKEQDVSDFEKAIKTHRDSLVSTYEAA